MGRRSCCTKEGVNRGAWSSSEDKILADYINTHGEGKWRELPKRAGLRRCGKSCRLRWLNYLQPNIKRGNISHDEEDLILRLHKLLGNRWSLIAGRLPGRTDNEIKNYWNTTLSKKSSGERKRESREIGVIRTKAARLRKVFIPPPQPSSFRDLEFSPGVVDLDVEELMRAAEGLGDGFFFLEEEFVKDWGDCLLPVGAEEN